jgi:hypothetical protein
MVEGYISYKLFYYDSEYIKKINETQSKVVWYDKWDEEEKEREILQKK